MEGWREEKQEKGGNREEREGGMEGWKKGVKGEGRDGGMEEASDGSRERWRDRAGREREGRRKARGEPSGEGKGETEL